MTPASPITDIKGVGARLSALYAKLGVETIQDLAELQPRRYLDYRSVKPVADVRVGPVTILARFKDVSLRRIRGGKTIVEATAYDDSGSIKAVWFNQPYRADLVKEEGSFLVAGEVAIRAGRVGFTNPVVEKLQESPTHTARLVPIYPETKGLTSSAIRRTVMAIESLFYDLSDTIPPALRDQHKLAAYGQLLHTLHFPETYEAMELARQELALRELIVYQLAAQLNRSDNAKLKAPQLKFHEHATKQLVESLPYQLTDSQRQSAWQILGDLQASVPMNRLLEGEVGSGKTIVAALAALNTVLSGYQAALVAPTEVLARQHYENLRELLEVPVELITSSLKTAERRSLIERIESGEPLLVIGTHALLSEKYPYSKLALVIVDEQHRFGVEQRRTLLARTGHMPHSLCMTATPIPRSLALTLFGELDLVQLASRPSKQPIKTKVTTAGARPQVYRAVLKELVAGRQAFIVAPKISAGEGVSVDDLEKALKQLLPKVSIGVLHGRQKKENQDEVMRDFKSGRTQILLATTVIEVGIDVQNATVMVIEGAERFGLAQLHQLRGRVGRGEHPGFCYVLPSPGVVVPERLKRLEAEQDGLKLAESDLELRGPGEIYGLKQHGALDLRFAHIGDRTNLDKAKAIAQAILVTSPDLVQYNQLRRQVMKARALTTLN